MQDSTKTDIPSDRRIHAASSPRRSPYGLLALAIVLLAALTIYLANRNVPSAGTRVPLASGVQSSLMDQLKVDPALIRYRLESQIAVPLEDVRAIAVGPEQRIYVAGDQAIAVFGANGQPRETHELDIEPIGLGIGGDDHFEPGRLYVGSARGIVVLDAHGEAIQSWPPPNAASILAAIAVGPRDVFVSDAGNRLVWRYNVEGELIGQIGQSAPGLTPRFVVTSSHFDVATGSEGLIHVANPGRLQIATYTYEGDRGISWGRANSSISGFFGCCNPAHFAVLPDGRFVTSEKGIPRVKIYDATGRFESVVAGLEQLGIESESVVDARTTDQLSDFDVATDAQGRVLVLDPRKKVVRVFVRKDEPENPRGES